MFESLTHKTSNRTIALLIGIGLIAGVLGGLLGIGGGAFVVPVLVFLLAFSRQKAHGVSLAVVLALSIAGVAVYSMHRCVSLLPAIEIALGSVIGAMLGVFVAQAVRSVALRRTLSISIVAVGVKMAWDGFTMAHVLHSGGGPASITGGLWVIGAGVVAGLVSALLGVGTGIVMVPMLTVFLHFPQQEAQGVSLAAMMPIAFAGMLKHSKLGNVDFRVAEWIAFGAVIGAIAGAAVANALHPGHLKLAFGAFLVMVAALTAAKKKPREPGV